jgi:HAD superfamily hydrolase (TIGR01509 family)
MKSALLLDWDGVILNSEPSCLEASNAVLRAHNLPTVGAKEYRNRSSNGPGWFQERGVELPAEEIRKLFYQNFDGSHCALVPGIAYVLGYFSKKGLPCAIVSAHHEEDIKQRAKAFGIEQYFDVIIGDAKGSKKDALVHTCKQLGVERLSTLFVEDMPAGVLDGKAVGLKTALYAPRDSPHAEHADHHLLHMLDLMDIV